MEKAKIIDSLKEVLFEKVKEAEIELDSIQQSKTNETKSSAGDKYETGMAMLQLEEQKAAVQLAKARSSYQLLSRIDENEIHSSVQLGTWVETTQGIYFFAVAYGKMHIEQKEFFVLSVSSPIGQLLLGKKVGDEVVFQGKKIVINYLN